MVTENNDEEAVVEEEISTSAKPRKKKSKYTHIQKAANLRVFDLKVKETDDSGNREWKEYKVAASGVKEALKLVNHDGYAPYNSVESGIYEG